MRLRQTERLCWIPTSNLTKLRTWVIRWVLNTPNPGMIEAVDRHPCSPRVNGLAKTNFTEEPVPINYSFVKVSGG